VFTKRLVRHRLKDHLDLVVWEFVNSGHSCKNFNSAKGWFRCFQKENVEAMLKEANNYPLEFEELPHLQQLASLGKVPSTLIFLFVQVFVHT
jgi:hypothetical protein